VKLRLNKPWLLLPVALILALGLTFAVSESMGWPFLATPLQNLLEQRMGRTVRLQGPADSGASSAALHFWGGLRLQTPLVEIGAPTWSQAPYMVSAQDVDVRLRYGDVWRAYRGHQLVVKALAADRLTVYLERLADGRASWQFAPDASAPARPHVQSMEVHSGLLHYNDAPLALNFDANLALASTAPTPSAVAALPDRVLRGNAIGHYRNDAFQLSLLSTGALPWEADSTHSLPATVKLAAHVGRASLEFSGTAQDFLHLNGLDGTFRVQGPSLAAIGAPLGITLPTTPAFHANGQVRRSGALWTMALQQAQVGTSQLSGSFVFDTAAAPSRLSGTLNGTMLKLTDLALAVGAAPAGSATLAKVLPSRPFNLATLRAMDADVHIAIAEVDTNTSRLEPLRPFAAHLLLHAGVLTLTDMDAGIAQGHLGGTLSLDGQQEQAHWVAVLHWDGVQLQRWIHQPRATGLPPYVSGQLQGHATLQGSGRSTAEILANLQGDMGATVAHGTLSHLLVELGGLDLAESLGVYVKGDNALVLNCALADLSVAGGTLRPRLLVLDTSDSTVWLDGTLSLATERLDLRVVVAPKDVSVMTLRSPLHIGGSFARPVVSVEKGPLGLKLGSAILLGLINPLAAILPLVDAGNPQGAQTHASGCQIREKLQRGGR
jgi:uncharacterized protein involved in outer membrane biogenesis